MPEAGVHHRKAGRFTRQRNSQLERKLALRRSLTLLLPPGPVYMAYAGTCQLAPAYENREVYAADWKAELFHEVTAPNVVSWLQADCEKEFPFPGVPFVFADFDAFAMPYPALRVFLESARLGNNVGLVFSDTALLRIFQHPQFVVYPCGRRADLRGAGVDRKAVWDGYVDEHMLPSLLSLMPGYSVVEAVETRWKNSVFWGCALSRVQ